MNSAEKIDKLASVAYEIQKGQTGNLEEFAKKCELKKDRLFDYIDILRQFTGREGGKIRYSKDRRTYYFDPPGKFIDFKFKAFY